VNFIQKLSEIYSFIRSEGAPKNFPKGTPLAWKLQLSTNNVLEAPNVHFGGIKARRIYLSKSVGTSGLLKDIFYRFEGLADS